MICNSKSNNIKHRSQVDFDEEELMLKLLENLEKRKDTVLRLIFIKSS